MSRSDQQVTEGTLSVRSVSRGEIVVVSLAGELDRANVELARRLIDDAFARAELTVVIDLQELDSVDSGGIALLLSLNGRQGAGRPRIVPSRSLGVFRVLAATGAESLVRFVQDRAGARPS